MSPSLRAETCHRPVRPGSTRVRKVAELGWELFQVVIREGPGTYQAHFSFQDAPQLRQFVQAHAPQQEADSRQHAGVVFQFEEAAPLDMILGMVFKPGVQNLSPSSVHGAELPYGDAAAVEAFAHLPVEGGATAQKLDPQGGAAITGRLRINSGSATIWSIQRFKDGCGGSAGSS